MDLLVLLPAGAGVLPWASGWTAMAHWPCTVKRLQRHEGDGSACRRRLIHRAIGALLPDGRADRPGLHRLTHVVKLAHRQRDRGHARKSATSRDARLRRP